MMERFKITRDCSRVLLAGALMMGLATSGTAAEGLISGDLCVAAGSLTAVENLPATGNLPSAAESEAMLREADDFLDAMPDGLQDRQRDAINHALHGMGGELAAIRESRNVEYKVSEKVVTKDIIGDGAARGIKMRLYVPKKYADETSGKGLTKKGEGIPLLVYYHGGGWTIGSINSCAKFCDALASGGDVMVLAVDYSLSPEKTYPTPLYDCVASLEFAFGKAQEWGADADRISVGGDSAGGNLALATVLYRQMQGDKTEGDVKSMVLFYPVTKGFADKSESWRKYRRGYGLDGRLMEAFCESYLGGGDAKDLLVSPGLAPDERIEKLPPMLIINAERDILADQGAEFFEKVKNKKDGSRRIVFDGAVHLFVTKDGQATAFRKAVALADEFLGE